MAKDKKLREIILHCTRPGIKRHHLTEQTETGGVRCVEKPVFSHRRGNSFTTHPENESVRIVAIHMYVLYGLCYHVSICSWHVVL